MAGYYHGAAGSSEIQGEGLQTLYLMNPSYVSYTHDNHVGTAPPPPAASPASMVFFSSSGNPIGQANLDHLHQQNPAYVGIPLQQDINRLHYNLWRPADPSATASPDSAAQIGLRRPASQQQGLSLSLSPHQPAYSAYRPGGEIPAPASAISPGGAGGDEARITGSTSSNSGVSNGGIAGLQGVLVGSKYLKATQELLDEVVNVGGRFVKDEKMKGRGEAPATDGGNPVPPPDNCGGEAGAGKKSGELSTAERQELQTKKAKLVNMLDEVEQRYRQYHHQMQIIVAAFEAATGPGSARTYTALALQTISRQFRCLRDAIAGQIRAARRTLGEEVGASCSAGGSSRLRAVDQQLRQQRALQQLGMGQGPSAWRPQRGLPERSVSVLRAWLFEHFLHPYPKDSDKIILAKQTGLTRSQVSNWFINARVRLWKPMVEEMYLEEMKDQEPNGGSEGKAGKSIVDANEETSTKSTTVPASTSLPADDNMNNNVVQMNKLNDQAAAMGQPSCFPLLGQPPDSPAVNFDGEDEEEELEMVRGSSKKLKNDLHDHFANTMPLMGSGLMELKPNISSDGVGNDDQFCGERRPTGYSLMGNAAGDIQGGGGFGVYQNYLDQFAPRFPGNGVSLTLGLPHCESGPSLAMAGAHQSFLSVQGIQMGGEENDFCDINGAASSTTTHSATAFENINIQNRKGFATQLLQDFVV